ncbi:VWA domain-containing protein, partial [bacterium]|nr:VWA domain-containing protein [bacterium]
MRYWRLLALSFLAIVCLAVPAFTRDFDLVLLLDESGSMQKTDPCGMRKEATRMFLRLCGPGQRVGLMGFATDVRVVADSEDMGGQEGMEKLLARTARIQSEGLYTDIESALRSGLDELMNWNRPETPLAVLLMTDGAVDLSGEEEAVRDSIATIRGPLMSEYLQHNVRIYCIAFSGGADYELLEYLAETTGGLAAQSDKEEDLQRLFLRLFEDLARPQSVPMDEGQVLLDSSVQEATFLIAHREEEGEQVRLINPDGKAVSRRSSETLEEVRWFSAPTYQLVTVRSPQAGRWRVDSSTIEGDRVIVLTDLELVLDDFESYVRPGERTWLLARLVTEGQTVTEPTILSRLVIRAQVKASTSAVIPLADDGEHADGSAGDGLFGGVFEAPQETGSCDVEILARAPVLERRILRTLHVVNRWFEAQVEREVVSPGETVPITVRVETDNLPEGEDVMSFEATVLRPDGSRLSLEVIPVARDLYAVSFEETMQTGLYRLTVTGEVGKEGPGRIRDTVGPIEFRVRPPQVATLALPGLPHREPAAPVATPTPVPSPAPEPEVKVAVVPSDGPEGISLLILVAASLLVVLLLGGVAWWYVRPRFSKSQGQSMEPLRERAARIREEKHDTSEEKRTEGEAASPSEEPTEAGLDDLNRE